MNKETVIKNILPQIKEASLTTSTNEEFNETANYIWLFKSNNCREHYEVNNIITKQDTWADFKSIRSLNDHGHEHKIKGITLNFLLSFAKF